MGGAVRRRENPFRKRIILIGFNSDYALGACDASLAKNLPVRLNEIPKNEMKEIGIIRIIGLRRRQYYSHYSNYFQIKPTLLSN